MKVDVLNLDASAAGDVELDEAVFGVEPRADILHRVVRWQRAKAQAGTHKAKGRSEVSYSTRKIYRQKGTGGARHGSRGAPIFVKGGKYGGPVVRSHAHELPKKVRALGLKMALSDKASAGNLIVLENATLQDGKTRTLKGHLDKLGVRRKALLIDGPELDAGFARASRNLAELDVLPSQGANVYDIMRRDTLIVTRAGLDALMARLADNAKEAAA